MYENTLNGQIVDGHVVLDPFPGDTSGTDDPTGGCLPSDSYGAVNAPFDPVTAEMEQEPVEA